MCNLSHARKMYGESRTSKIIQRHLWQSYLDKAEELRYTTYNKIQYARRKETVERVFADAKEKHGLRWTKLRGGDKKSTLRDACFCDAEFEKTSHLDVVERNELAK